MSDKTKYYADQALMHRRLEAQRQRDMARGDQRPRCLCGFTFTDRVILAVSDRRDQVTFYCEDCGPDDVKGHIREITRNAQ